MEYDLNIFENGRRPQFFLKGRLPTFFVNGRQSQKSNANKKNKSKNNNIFENGRQP